MGVHAEIVDGRIVLETSYRHSTLAKQIPGSRWRPNERVWVVPLSWASCKQLRGVFGSELIVGPDLVEWATREYERRVAPAREVRDLMDVDGDHEPHLYGFQKVGVEFLTITGRAILADAMGTGKTIQLISTMKRLEDAFPALIVAPNSVKRNWIKELQKWAPDLDVRRVDGGERIGGPKELTDLPGVGPKKAQDIGERLGVKDCSDLRQQTHRLSEVLSTTQVDKIKAALEDTGIADVYVVNWEALRLHSRLASYGNKTLSDAEKQTKDFNTIPWRTVIADEAHKAKSPNSKQARALWAIAHGLGNPDHNGAPYRFALTGTPIANAPDDLWSLLHFIDEVEWPSKSKYIDRYAMVSWNPWGGLDILGVHPETRDEFYDILDSRFIRRPKKLVLPQLADKIYVERYSDMDSKQRKAYEQMQDELLADIGEGDDMIVATEAIVQNTRLLQLAAAYAVGHGEGGMLMAEPSCKLDEMMNVIEELGNQQVVIFALHKQLIDLAKARADKAGLTYGSITGDDSAMAREEAVDKFQNGDLQIMFCTVSAGGEGITLTAASNMIFLQRSWSMVQNRQAEDRVHRIGQDDQVTIINIVTPDTVEEAQLAALEGKLDRLEEIVRDKETLKRMLSGDTMSTGQRKG